MTLKEACHKALNKEPKYINGRSGAFSDADTILADLMMRSQQKRRSGIAFQVFRTWKSSTEREVLERLFENLLDGTFENFITACCDVAYVRKYSETERSVDALINICNIDISCQVSDALDGILADLMTNTCYEETGFGYAVIGDFAERCTCFGPYKIMFRTLTGVSFNDYIGMVLE